MRDYCKSHERLSEEVGWSTMFAEVFEIAAKKVPYALRPNRNT
jgi:hypothetical protein